MTAAPYRDPLAGMPRHVVEVLRDMPASRLLREGDFEVVPVGFDHWSAAVIGSLDVRRSTFVVRLADAAGDVPLHEIAADHASRGCRPAMPTEALAFAAAWTRHCEAGLVRLSGGEPRRGTEPALLGLIRDHPCGGRRSGAPCRSSASTPFPTFYDAGRRWLVMVEA